jgi:hypothetical protein
MFFILLLLCFADVCIFNFYVQYNDVIVLGLVPFVSLGHSKNHTKSSDPGRAVMLCFHLIWLAFESLVLIVFWFFQVPRGTVAKLFTRYCWV